MIIQDKLDLIDYFFRHYPTAAFAELGCVWGVDGEYGFYILDHYNVSRGIQVDLGITEKMKEKALNYPQLQFFQRNFCEADVPTLVGDVDVVILFDVLLHQVKPDWDDLLNMYAPRTKHFLIYNQQWISGAHTARLLDFGKNEYFKKIPVGSANDEVYQGLFDPPDEAISAEPGGRFRNSIFIWQWGITDADLITKLGEMGFNLQHFKNCGQAFGLPDFENHGFLFTRLE